MASTTFRIRVRKEEEGKETNESFLVMRIRNSGIIKYLTFLWILPVAFLFSCKSEGEMSSFLNQLAEHNCVPYLSVQHYDTSLFNKRISIVKQSLRQKTGILRDEINKEKWQVTVEPKLIHPATNTWELRVIYRLLSKEAKNVAASLHFQMNSWHKSDYVLLPGAAYNGNRFASRCIAYSPKLLDPRDIGADKEMIISDVPRLNLNPGPSRIQERSGSMSIPLAGFHSDTNKTAFLLYSEQGNIWGDYGFDVEENKNRTVCDFSVTSPLVREEFKYHITTTKWPSEDVPACLQKNDEIEIRVRIRFFPSSSTSDLSRNYFSLAMDSVSSVDSVSFPLSSCFEVIEKKFNTQNFVKDWGYYSVGMRENFLQDWQIGWTGGMISTYPLLFSSNPESNQNAIRNFNWLFPAGISPSGFFYDSGEKGNQWYGGDIRKPHTANWHLIRKSGDGLFYILKQFSLMRFKGIKVNPEWERGTRGVADAFVNLWKTQGQLGQFIDSRNGKVMVGGSTSGAIVPAALLAASNYFGNKEYKETAIAIAEKYYQEYVRKGITCGGPGDAMQNPDSESAYAMLESFVSMYEETKDKKWLQRTEEMAWLFSTWVMQYDYVFPPTSVLAKLGIRTTGAVCANTQNKHGAPGICTYSGNALLRLYRYTGNKDYALLLQKIVQHIPQNLSHPSRPIDGMKEGWMSERVSTTDWLEGIGEIMYGSTWAETSLMLSFVEIPGVYINTADTSCIVFDQVKAEVKRTPQPVLILHNPGKLSCRLRIFAEDSNQQENKLDIPQMMSWKEIIIQPGETKETLLLQVR